MIEFAAIMTVYNEEDILEHSLRRLVEQGIGVYVIDNWSTDGSPGIVQRYQGRGLLGYERFPAAGPDQSFALGRLMERVEQVHLELGARWTIHHDADEIREAPWPGLNYRQGLERAEREGFNAVNHVVVNFRPVADDFVPGDDMGRHFRHYEMPSRPGHFLQIKAWRTGHPVRLAEMAGHEVQFPGRRVHPTPFLLKHYPIRGTAHGRRKVVQERLARFDPGERRRGWHQHYDGMGPESTFLWDPAGLSCWDDASPRRILAFAQSRR